MNEVDRKMNIYFIQNEKDCSVKIGKATNVAKRISELQVGNADKLSVLYSFEVEDEKATEAERHIQNVFKHYCIRGEWFNPCPYLYDYITEIEEGGFWTDPLKEYERFLLQDPFSEAYHKAMNAINFSKRYGDMRIVSSITNNLKLLLEYNMTGRMS